MNFDDEVDRTLWAQARVYMDHPYSVAVGWCVTFAGFGVVWLFGG